MSATEDWGVWLIGLGALVIASRSILLAEKPRVGMSFQGPYNERSDRLRYATDGAGALLVAAGSVLVAIANCPPIELLAVLPAAYGVVHVLAAWMLRRYWLTGRLPLADESERAWVRACGQWRWCLRHPFNNEYWPESARPEADVSVDDRPRRVEP